MIWSDHVLMQPAAYAITWALLQFIWQGALIGAITAAALALLRRSAADVRYVVATIGLCLMMTMPVVTAFQTWRAVQGSRPAASRLQPTAAAATAYDPEPLAPDRLGPVAAAVPVRAAVEPPPPARAAAASWMSIVLLAWLSGVTVLSLRIASGWVWVRRMTSIGATAARLDLQSAGARLIRRLHVARPVRFLESTLVEVPTVIGWLRPVVLVPASAVAALTPAQLEAIIAHELAHIRRHDYLVNLLQTLVETLLFYHPAVWWLSRRIRSERENCCDDLAVNLCGDPVTYARALADLEDLRRSTRLALAATGGSLLQRVRRLLGAPSHAGRGPGWLAGAAAVLVMAGVAAGAAGRAVAQSGEASAAAAAAVERAVLAARAAMPQSPVPPLPAVAAESLSMRLARMEARGERARRSVEEFKAQIAASSPALPPLDPVRAAAVDMASASELLPALAESRLGEGSSLAPAAGPLAGASQKGNFVWSDGDERLEVDYSGAIEFTDDDADVKSLSPGGWLRISDGRQSTKRTVEFRADQRGTVSRRYWHAGVERPFEPEGREWLSRALPRFIRQTGLGAAGRVARIHRARGVDGVLAEIALFEGSWAKRVYFSELLKVEGLEPRAVEQILVRAGRELDSDFELASLLIGAAERLLVTDATRRAYFDAARSIDSDFEMRRVLAAALKKGSLSPEVLSSLLDASLAIGSDFEAAALLIQVAGLQPLDERSRPAFFKALAGVGSDFERRRVLNTLATRADLDAASLAALLESAALIDSDFEQAALLLTVLKHQAVEGPARAVFFKAVDRLDSAFERGRVLMAVAQRPDASADTVLAILRAAQGMKGSFETSRVLIAVAGAAHPLTGEARTLFLDIADELGEVEQGRALAALVRNERANR